MPLNTSNFVQNGHLIHQDLQQFVDLLTGVMVDQPVALGNTLQVAGATTLQNTLGVTGQISGQSTLQINGAISGLSTANISSNLTVGGPTSLGGTLSFANDNTTDIGFTATGRPRNVYVGSTLTAAAVVTTLLTVTNLTATGWITSPIYYVGSTNERLRNPANAAANLSIESADGNLMLSGNTAVQAAYNMYWDGTTWQRFNVANIGVLQFINSGGMSVLTATSGANPVSGFTTQFSLNTGGTVIIGGSMNVNANRLTNQGALNLRVAAAGSDVSIFAESGHLYHWLTNASGNVVFQNNVNAGWATIQCGPIVATGSITASANLFANGGFVSLRSDGGIGWQLVNTNYLRAVGANIVSDGQYAYVNSATIFTNWDGTGINHSHQIRGPSVFVTGGITTGNWNPGSWANAMGGDLMGANIMTWAGCFRAYMGYSDTSGNANAVIAPNIADNRGQVLAQSHPVWTCVDHAREYGLRVEKVADPLRVVKALDGYYYDHISFSGGDGSAPLRHADGTLESHPMYGFAASEVAEYLPELIEYSPITGNPEAIDLGRLVVILWEAVKQLERSVK